jgi:hypothetical protein
MACARHDTTMLSLLCDFGFSLKQFDLFGFSALFVCIYFGKDDLVRWILERSDGAILARQRNAWLDTPLHFAIRQMQNGACQVLVESGADSNALDL